MNKTKNRIFYYDLLRVIAIFSVIVCHATAMNPFVSLGGPKFISFPLDVFSYVGVPLFFMLSGALLLNKNYSLKTFFNKRFSRIVYPFIFWICIFAILGIFGFNFPVEKIISLVKGDGFTWFIWALIGLYLFIPIINSFIKENNFNLILYFLIFWLITIILNTIGKFPFHHIDLTYFSGYLGFLIMGYYLSNKNFNISNRNLMIISLIVFLVTFIIHSELKLLGIKFLMSSGYLNIFPVIESSSIFIFIKYFSALYCSKIDENKISYKTIYSISICSYAMYFIHIMVIDVLTKFNLIKMPDYSFIIIFLLSWIIAVIFSKIPFVKNICGVK